MKEETKNYVVFVNESDLLIIASKSKCSFGHYTLEFEYDYSTEIFIHYNYFISNIESCDSYRCTTTMKDSCEYNAKELLNEYFHDNEEFKSFNMYSFLT